MNPIPTLAGDIQALGRLRSGAQSNPQGALREIAGQFESLFTHMMLKRMRAASMGEGLFESRQAKMYRDMLDQEVAVQLSHQGGLGIADLLVRQLGGESAQGGGDASARRDVEPRLPRLSARTAPAAPSGVVETTSTHAFNPRDAIDFVRELWPHAKQAAQRLGVSVRGVLAQAALETGWGQRAPQRADGASSLNLFGIKAGADWTGARVARNTLEYRDGAMRQERADFRAYASLAESFDDYASLLESSPRYQDAIRIGNDPERFASELQRAGYATDPAYAEKISGIANGSEMRAALQALKHVQDVP